MLVDTVFLCCTLVSCFSKQKPDIGRVTFELHSLLWTRDLVLSRQSSSVYYRRRSIYTARGYKCFDMRTCQTVWFSKPQMSTEIEPPTVVIILFVFWLWQAGWSSLMLYLFLCIICRSPFRWREFLKGMIITDSKRNFWSLKNLINTTLWIYHYRFCQFTFFPWQFVFAIANELRLMEPLQQHSTIKEQSTCAYSQVINWLCKIKLFIRQRWYNIVQMNRAPSQVLGSKLKKTVLPSLQP